VACAEELSFPTSSSLAFLPILMPIPVESPTGKIEIFSTLIWEKYGYNPEIPPVPHYIP